MRPAAESRCVQRPLSPSNSSNIMAQPPGAPSCISEPAPLPRVRTSRQMHDDESDVKAARIVELRKLLVESEAARRTLEATAAEAQARAAEHRSATEDRERECGALRQEVCA